MFASFLHLMCAAGLLVANKWLSSSILALFVGFVVWVMNWASVRGKGMPALKAKWKDLKWPTIASIVAYVFLFFLAVIKIVYEDHQSKIAEIQVLNDQTKTDEQKQLEAVKKKDRHYSRAERDKLIDLLDGISKILDQQVPGAINGLIAIQKIRVITDIDSTEKSVNGAMFAASNINNLFVKLRDANPAFSDEISAVLQGGMSAPDTEEQVNALGDEFIRLREEKDQWEREKQQAEQMAFEDHKSAPLEQPWVNPVILVTSSQIFARKEIEAASTWRVHAKYNLDAIRQNLNKE